MRFTADGLRPLLIVTATPGRRESKGISSRNRSTLSRPIGLLDSCCITMKLSAPRAEL
jgi:hypothetical protein